ncbi:MAG: GTP 3',8-cyclase MoaA [Hyphomonadaceae bacterium]
MSSRPTPLPALMDGFGRTISYVRISVTDRCDLRCAYCMRERTTFSPKAELLTFEELDRLCALFVQRGVRRLRITGGEPLVRRGILDFMAGLSRHLRTGALDELTLTTNGVQLAGAATALANMGVKRVNVSLDTLDRAVFARITRRDRLADVLEGIAAARAAGLKVKINTVALKQDNAREIPDLIRWAHAGGMDIALIETMPMGDIEEDRTAQFLSLADVRRDLESYWSLTDTDDAPGAGPARYAHVRETGGKVGFITPMSHNFCATCNRVRLTCFGRLYMCLGQDDSVDFRTPLREGADDSALAHVLERALSLKPKAHDFVIAPRAAPAVARTMSVTGG